MGCKTYSLHDISSINIRKYRACDIGSNNLVEIIMKKDEYDTKHKIIIFYVEDKVEFKNKIDECISNLGVTKGFS